MATTLIRIPETARKALRQLASETGATMQDVLTEAIKDYQDKVFWDGVNQDFARLRKDKKKWTEELKEREQWESTLMDGLEED